MASGPHWLNQCRQLTELNTEAGVVVDLLVSK